MMTRTRYCVACGAPMIQLRKRGSPPVTCSRKCRLDWRYTREARVRITDRRLLLLEQLRWCAGGAA